MAIHAWISWRSSSLIAWLGIAYLSVVIAMTSKEDACSLPIILVIIDYFLLTKSKFREKLINFAPLFVWLIVWIILDIAAYRHVSEHSPEANIHEQHIGITVPYIFAIIHKTFLLGIFKGLDYPSEVVGDLGLLVGVSVMLFYFRYQKPVLITVACFLLTAIPIPLMTGNHSSSERFNFLPLCWSSTIWSMIISTLISDSRQINRLIGLVALSNCELCHLSDIDFSTDLLLYVQPTIIGICVIASVIDKRFRFYWIGLSILTLVNTILNISGITTNDPVVIWVIFATCLIASFSIKSLRIAILVALSILSPLSSFAAMVMFCVINALTHLRITDGDSETMNLEV
jgi:hypothetical protein